MSEVVDINKAIFSKDLNKNFNKFDAKELISQALINNEKIHFFWSGSVASSTQLILLYQELETLHQKTLLKVFLYQEAIDEFELFFLTFIQKSLNHSILSN